MKRIYLSLFLVFGLSGCSNFLLPGIFICPSRNGCLIHQTPGDATPVTPEVILNPTKPA